MPRLLPQTPKQLDRFLADAWQSESAISSVTYLQRPSSHASAFAPHDSTLYRADELAPPTSRHTFYTSSRELVDRPKRNTFKWQPFHRELCESRGVDHRVPWKGVQNDVQKVVSDFNDRVYEGRVAKSYVNEQLAQHMYNQKMMDHTNALRARHRRVVQAHTDREIVWGTPRGKYLVAEAQMTAALADFKEHQRPHFRDVDEMITPHLERSIASSRGLGDGSSGNPNASFTSPSVLSTTVPLPPLHLLMRPIKASSPMPDVPQLSRDFFSPRALLREQQRAMTSGGVRMGTASSMGESGGGGGGAEEAAMASLLMESAASGKPQVMSISNVLRLVARAFDEKYKADDALRRRMGLDLDKFVQLDWEGASGGGWALNASTGVLAGVEVEIPISLNQVVRDLIKKDMGSSSKALLREKYEQLCHSCLPGVGHGGHARIALFASFACLGEDAERWPAAQEFACIQLLAWLRIANSNPPKKDPKLMLPLRDVGRMAESLKRLMLVPPNAVRYLKGRAFDVASQAAMAQTLGGGGALHTDSLASLSNTTRAPPSSPSRPKTSATTLSLGSTSGSPSKLGGTSSRAAAPQKVDADELLLCWMNDWGEWVDEVLRPGFVIGDL